MEMQQMMFVGLAAAAMFIQLAVAANYTVGSPNGGWDTSTDLQTWASSQTFAVGDNLIFLYTPNHDVLEVSKSDYDKCQSSSALDSFSDGNTVIPLNSTGNRYFICGTTGHCLMGMKLAVNTQASSTSSTPPAAASPVPTPPPASAPTKKDSSLSPAVSPAPADEVIPPSSESPSASPAASSPDIEFPKASPTPTGLSLPTPTPPSSANRASSQTSLLLGFALVSMIRIF